MRIMVVRPGPRYSVLDVHQGLVKALRQLGHDVYDYRLDDTIEIFNQTHIKRGARWRPAFTKEGVLNMAAEWLQAATYRYWPDIVIVVSGFWVPEEMWRIWKMRPTHVVAYLTESPYEEDLHLKLSDLPDTIILNDPLNLERFRAVNPRTWYIPHSYDPDLHRPGPGWPEWRCDVAFAGTGFPSRQQFVEQVDWSGIDLKLGGMWVPAKGTWIEDRLVHPIDECIDNWDTVVLYRSARVGFNLYRQETTPGGDSDGIAVGPREVEMAATGLFFLRDPRPEGDELFPMLPTFDGPGDFSEKVRWWLDNSVARNNAARKAREAVAGHTFTAHAGELLRLIDGHRKTLAV